LCPVHHNCSHFCRNICVAPTTDGWKDGMTSYGTVHHGKGYGISLCKLIPVEISYYYDVA
jgi:hypothetical protein